MPPALIACGWLIVMGMLNVWRLLNPWEWPMLFAEVGEELCKAAFSEPVT
jgi:hypothetical protein